MGDYYFKDSITRLREALPTIYNDNLVTNTLTLTCTSFSLSVFPFACALFYMHVMYLYVYMRSIRACTYVCTYKNSLYRTIWDNIICWLYREIGYIGTVLPVLLDLGQQFLLGDIGKFVI